MVDRNNGQLDIANRMVFPMPELERVFESFDWAGAQRRRHAVRRRLRRAREVPVRPAQRQADRDHLPRHQGPRRALRFPEQAQGHGARCADRAGDRAAGGAAPRPRRRVQRVLSTASANAPTATPLQDDAARHRARHAPRRLAPRSAGELSLDQVIGPVRTSAAPRRNKRSATTRARCRASIRRRSTRPATSSRRR